jgi:hypothetical protein
MPVLHQLQNVQGETTRVWRIPAIRKLHASILCIAMNSFGERGNRSLGVALRFPILFAQRSKLKPTAMTEIHPSSSAIGTHLDEDIEKAARAKASTEEERRAVEDRMNAARELRKSAMPTTSSRPSDADLQTEEAMHLDL